MHVAGCGGSTDDITVYDLLDGSCAWGQGVLPTSGLLQCTGQIYGRVCPGFAGNLYIVYTTVGNTPGASPNTQAFLNTLGLGSVTYVGQLYVVSPSNSGGPIAPVFLPSLTTIGGDLRILRDPAVTVSIVALPGLAAIRQIGKFALLGNFEGASGPLFTDLTSLASLECVGEGFGLYQTPQVTTTAGLEKLSVVNYSGGILSGPLIVFITTGVATPAALAPLSLVANCIGGPAFAVNIGVTGCPAPLSTTTALCTYISSGVC